MANDTYEPKLNAIYEHVRGWVSPKGKPNRPNYFTIVGCMAGAVIDYRNQVVVHIGVSARNLDDEVDKALGREIALKRALDVDSAYKIHISKYGVSQWLWDNSINIFAYRCFKHFHIPVLFPTGMQFTRYPTILEKKADKNAVPTKG